ncbi:bifunctional phosphoribosyl-AMP cyclohydrolase/phosphoribosyl-ATP diphosphatase HisIE [candidate division KSB1 bacterium]|nr:MAG: bifunctional phosphoribosyl-AMP cyclohydrolase/phosphoribosyl-ATP diphosphatase HisIE [candidate division KSB1 bacterium]MBC6949908.1 bifunctional phosphoribosyl-AMP cyclohydrolase/phosphoribosyl-ATP diphosphatase HisIE [candidate division KSB1 bacterium]MCE7945229.1 bifunctional phosphoribosyl-AMP cyclohydrolase/phosphoribosyl-ATP diphosphatase HisIE [Chlorobi bacterium CHB1]MDL1877231.1 bifunctional phosphoribosyl-AMP cyclohydrolase/phosphoribosyl-ATP diphosphatase HisIE [Cytophagia ba
MPVNLNELQFDPRGLLPAIVQHAETGEVLTLAYMNRESLQQCLDTGETWFFSRSRQQLWHKGETSGNVQHIVSIKFDCDADALLVQVIPAGPACHTGERTCFYRALNEENEATSSLPQILAELQEVIQQRQRKMPEGSYTTTLFNKGVKKIAQKVGEEALEVALASVNEPDERLASETADLLYHLLVLLAARNISLGEVAKELTRRRK